MFDDELGARSDGSCGREAVADERWHWGARAGAARAVDLYNFKAKGSLMYGLLTISHELLFSILNYRASEQSRSLCVFGS